MLNRVGISLLAIAALLAAPIQVNARTCIVSDAPIQKACKPGCCANKSCCASSQKKPASSPLAKSSSATEFNATYVAIASANAPRCLSLDRQFSFSRAVSCAIAQPQLAVLCTFLI
ncbi:MAG: hypothetical protein DME57_09040 [Verrucomicrobia bacterium]|nr:MAG: hypothetical protein DME57_09040 [Verrucomicrobiota bacterium]